MKILFVMDRMHLNELTGYSINAKRTMESLAEKGIEVFALCHGKNEKIKIFELSNYSLYKRVFSFPLTSFLSIKKLNEVFAMEKFDAVIAKPLISTREGFWNSVPGIPLNDSVFYSTLRKKCRQQNAKLLYLIDGITEKNSFKPGIFGQASSLS